MTPPGFLIDGILRDRPQRPNGAAIHAYRAAGDVAAWRFIHKRHEFVGKPRHGAANTNAPNVRAAANSSHPPAFGNVTVHHGTPASQLHDALRRPVHLREVPLFVVSCAVATFMDRLAEEPC